MKEEYEKLQQDRAGSVQPPRVEYEEAQFIEPGAENDFYTGERKDILLSVLEDALASLKPGSRRRDVVASVIAANGGGEKQRAREKELKAILRGYVSMDASVRTRLQKFGFVINGAVCTLMELIGGLLVNADHSLWDYSDMFCNFMGQICLQNAVGFGLACTLIVWIVYPAMERAIARIPGDVMNVAFVGCLAFNLILQVLYLVEPAEIANAFTVWGQVLSGNATATFIALPLLGQLRF